MHDLFFPFYSVGIEPKVNTGTFDVAKVLIFSEKTQYFSKKFISDATVPVLQYLAVQTLLWGIDYTFL